MLTNNIFRNPLYLSINIICREFSAIARKEIETKGYTFSVAQDWIKQESNHKNQTGINPSTQNWPGDLNFDLRIQPAVKSKDAQVCDINPKIGLFLIFLFKKLLSTLGMISFSFQIFSIHQL